MFPKWEFDVEDTPAENIIKLMFVKNRGSGPWIAGKSLVLGSIQSWRL